MGFKHRGLLHHIAVCIRHRALDGSSYDILEVPLGQLGLPPASSSVSLVDIQDQGNSASGQLAEG